MLDCQLFGLKAGGHHFTNVLLPYGLGALLFLLLRQMTGAFWQSAFVAALFAVHPLHVESVAWVSERKDVLSGVFFMLTLWAYTRYVQARSTGRYLTVALFFVLGLMSKPMLVTLPFVLLLLDYWPLNRFSLGPHAPRHAVPGPPTERIQSRLCLWKKFRCLLCPLFRASRLCWYSSTAQKQSTNCRSCGD